MWLNIHVLISSCCFCQLKPPVQASTIQSDAGWATETSWNNRRIETGGTISHGWFKQEIMLMLCCKERLGKQRVLMHGHQGWNVRHGLCHIYMRYVYIWVVYSFCLFCCLFIVVTWWYVWCIEWASGNQEEVQACLVTLCLFILSCYNLYKTTLGLLCSWFENNPYYHKY